MSKAKCIEYEGDRYYKRPDGYYCTSRTKGDKRLHVQMYQDYWNCIIPKGFVVHHKDDNKENNTVDNYFLLTNAGHVRWHNNHMSKERKEKVRLAHVGKTHSEESKEKVSLANIGKHSTGKYGTFMINLD